MTRHRIIRPIAVLLALCGALTIGPATGARGEQAEPDRSPASADAAERWADSEYQARVDLCTAAPASADALERCIGRG